MLFVELSALVKGENYKLLYEESDIDGALAKIKEIKKSNPGNIMA